MRLSHVRPLAVGVALTLVTALVGRVLLGSISAPLPAPARFEDVLVRGCLIALLVCLTWTWLAALACVGDAMLASPPPQRRGVPPLVRRLVLLACGVTLAATASPALAAPDAGPDPTGEVASLVAGLPLPDRTVDRAVERAGEPAGRAAARTPVSLTLPVPAAAPATRRAEVEVRPGDSLWSITRHALPTATAAEVDRAWRDLYRANRTVIGDDPDLIRPGMRLRLPASLGAGSGAEVVR